MRILFQTIAYLMILVVCFAFVYYYFFSKPEQDRLQAEKQQQMLIELQKETEMAKEAKKEEAKQMLLVCLDNADRAYSTRWKKHCLNIYQKEDCGLPESIANSYAQDKTKRKEECYRLHGIMLQ